MRTLHKVSDRIHINAYPGSLGVCINISRWRWLQYLVPLTINSTNIVLISHIVGIILLIGVPLALLSLGIFRAARTTTVPFEAASRLITLGSLPVQPQSNVRKFGTDLPRRNRIGQKFLRDD